MAGDWIKWVKGLDSKPEAIRIAALLSIPREIVAIRLMKFWEWCDENIPDDAIQENGSAFVTLSPSPGDNMAFVDALVGTPKFADSMAIVEWIRFRGDRLELPNFGRHNGKTAKTRARNANTQAGKRNRKAIEEPPERPPPGPDPVTEMSPRDGDKKVTREEKRRGESKDKNPPTPQGGIERCADPNAEAKDVCQAYHDLVTAAHARRVSSIVRTLILDGVPKAEMLAAIANFGEWHRREQTPPEMRPAVATFFSELDWRAYIATVPAPVRGQPIAPAVSAEERAATTQRLIEARNKSG